MSLPMITSTLAPFREALMMLGDCSFQFVQNMRLGNSRRQELWQATRKPFYRINGSPRQNKCSRQENGRLRQRSHTVDSLLTLIQHKGSRVVFSRHRNDSVAVISHGAALVYCVASDGGGGVTRPVECVPASVVRQTLN